MSDKVLVDTSIWIDFFKGPSPPIYETLSILLRNRQVVIAGIILVELLQGARNEKEVKNITHLLKPLDRVNFEEEWWEEAGLFSQRLRQKGLAIPTLDILIALLALKNNLTLYTHDKHFSMIARHSELILFESF